MLRCRLELSGKRSSGERHDDARRPREEQREHDPATERVFPVDYTRSGYDRGHLCPSSHRTRDSETNAATFLMTNMHPQVHALTAGPWKSAETYERNLAATPRTG